MEDLNLKKQVSAQTVFGNLAQKPTLKLKHINFYVSVQNPDSYEYLAKMLLQKHETIEFYGFQSGITTCNLTAQNLVKGGYVAILRSSNCVPNKGASLFIVLKRTPRFFDLVKTDIDSISKCVAQQILGFVPIRSGFGY